MEQRTITFIGAGNMAKAIISGLVSNNYPARQIIATAPSETRRIPLETRYGIRTMTDNIMAIQEADVIILSVKPQFMAEVCKPLQSLDLSQKLIISIAAGISISRLKEMLNKNTHIIRVMPNTPSLINEGMSGLFAPPEISTQDKEFAITLMKSVGEACWIENEADINGIIAASGSSPAYFFLLMEAMQEEAMRQGFDQATARLLIQQSALGAAKMVIANPNTKLSTLREQVTSKGGTTEKAINSFIDCQFSDMVAKAMQAAIRRAEEMEKHF